MKRFLLILQSVCLFSCLNAQPVVAGKELLHYVFPSFIEGTVMQKSGEVHKALLNYNSLTEEMIFEQSGQKMALDKIENIDTVNIQNRKFIPYGKVFFEVATNTPISLFIQYKSTIIPPAANVGFGTSQTAATTSITDIKRAGTVYKLQLPDEYTLASNPVYWLGNNNNYTIVKNAKDVQDVFPGKSAAIKAFVKNNKISFKNPEDVKKLILFCN